MTVRASDSSGDKWSIVMDIPVLTTDLDSRFIMLVFAWLHCSES